MHNHTSGQRKRSAWQAVQQESRQRSLLRLGGAIDPNNHRVVPLEWLQCDLLLGPQLLGLHLLNFRGENNGWLNGGVDARSLKLAVDQNILKKSDFLIKGVVQKWLASPGCKKNIYTQVHVHFAFGS